MTSRPTALLAGLAVLLVASAVLFGFGARAERAHERRSEPGVHATEGSEAREAAERTGTAGGGGTSEELFGIRTESAASSAVVIALSALAAVAVVKWPRGTLLVAVAVFALALAALDGREALHQHREAQAGLVAVALMLATAYGTIAALAAVGARHDLALHG